MAMGTEAVFKNSRNNVGFGSNYQRLAQIAPKWLIQSVLADKMCSTCKSKVRQVVRLLVTCCAQRHRACQCVRLLEPQLVTLLAIYSDPLLILQFLLPLSVLLLSSLICPKQSTLIMTVGPH